MPGPWMQVDRKTRVRLCEDGKWQTETRENVSASLRAKQEMRKATRKHPGVARGKGSDSDFHVIASLPETVEMEMNEECGHDPDKRASWLRDHPEHLTATPRAIGLPAKKTMFLPKGKTP